MKILGPQIDLKKNHKSVRELPLAKMERVPDLVIRSEKGRQSLPSI